jgi:hypothetical protein
VTAAEVRVEEMPFSVDEFDLPALGCGSGPRERSKAQPPQRARNMRRSGYRQDHGGSFIPAHHNAWLGVGDLEDGPSTCLVLSGVITRLYLAHPGEARVGHVTGTNGRAHGLQLTGECPPVAERRESKQECCLEVREDEGELAHDDVEARVHLLRSTLAMDVASQFVGRNGGQPAMLTGLAFKGLSGRAVTFGTGQNDGCSWAQAGLPRSRWGVLFAEIGESDI